MRLLQKTIPAALIVASCGGQATSDDETPAVGDDCGEVLEPFTAYEEPGCYVVPEAPRLSFAHYRANANCSIQNNGQELRSFTLWDVLEPGELRIEGCPFEVMFVLADDWDNWPEGEGDDE